jgi:YegS/Rv2252/BmrU family lipid kinase
MSEVCFIVNPRSGAKRGRERLVDQIRRIWRDAGREPEVLLTAHRGHGGELAARAAASGVPLVVAVGGDGTINEVAAGLVGSDTALGIVPAGSGNGFARNFGIPLEQETAIRSLLNPVLKRVDVGTANGRHFFCGMGIGLDAAVAAGFDRFGVRGRLPYFVVGVREFLRYRPQPVEVRLEGEVLRGSPLLLYLANTPQYGSGAVIAPHAQPDDGALDVCWLAPVSALSALRNVRRLFDGTIDAWEAMTVRRTQRATVHRAEAGHFHLDGDPYWGASMLEVDILPGRLKLAVGVAKGARR